MNIPLTASFAVASLLIVACEQKPAQLTSSTPAQSPTPAESVEPSEGSEAAPALAVASPATEGSATPPQSGTSVPAPVFRTEAATQAASQYLDTYTAVLNDISAAPGPRSTDPQTGLNNVKAQLQKLARDNAELANREKEVDRQLTPEEKKRLRQYQKSLEQAGQDQ